MQFNKAIVGKNAFAHESGIHQDGMLKNPETYEIMRPEDVGQSATNLVMGKHSGRHAFREKLKELGYELGENALNEAFRASRTWPTRRSTSSTTTSSPWSTTPSSARPATASRSSTCGSIAGTEGRRTPT